MRSARQRHPRRGKMKFYRVRSGEYTGREYAYNKAQARSQFHKSMKNVTPGKRIQKIKVSEFKGYSADTKRAQRAAKKWDREHR